MQSQGIALRTTVSGLPEDGRLDELAAGTAGLVDGNRKLKDGAQHLDIGLEMLADEIPDSVDDMGGSAEGLANSVRPEIEVVAAVQNNGSAYAPNIIPAALWLGAGVAAFLIHVSVLPREAKGFSRITQFLGKIAVPSFVVLLQVAVAGLGAAAMACNVGKWRYVEQSSIRPSVNF